MGADEQNSLCLRLSTPKRDYSAEFENLRYRRIMNDELLSDSDDDYDPLARFRKHKAREKLNADAPDLTPSASRHFHNCAIAHHVRYNSLPRVPPPKRSVEEAFEAQ